MGNKDVIKHMDFEIPTEIIDEETGEQLPADPEKINKALMLISDVQHDTLRMAKNIGMFFEERLYLYVGLTKTEAAQKCFGLHIDTIRKFIRINQTFGDQIDQFMHLGVTRMDKLTGLPEEQKQELLQQQSITLDDGSVISIKDLKEIKTSDLEKTLKAERLKSSRLNVQNTEMKEEYEAEINNLKTENQHLNNLIDIPEDEQKFHKKITKLNEARHKIYEAQANIHAAFLNIHQIQLDNDNKSIVSEVEGFMIANAKRLLDLEAEYGTQLGYYKESLKTMAGEPA